ncbi:MAG: hypothetical protein JRN62_03725 [Nitrososphaerota archaeon]|jgi:hypothetical protein|nr:hypothetical protein [Nitrososphaerota archaeon]MDG6948711.1 hypothetical protein [Nitrososphaerota archaeon]
MEIMKTTTLERWRILRVLGYDVDRDNHVTKEGKLVLDYYGSPVDVRHCAIFPGKEYGTAVVINDDLLNLTAYQVYVEEPDDVPLEAKQRQ